MMDQVRTSREGAVLRVVLDRPARKNPLTFESYAWLRDLFRGLANDRAVSAVTIAGAGGNFCSGGDVFEIIEPLTKMDMPGLLAFTRMTGDLVRAMRACPQPIVAAVDGVCAGAGAIIAMASDLRLGTEASRTAFLFNRVGLAGCDMGACAILPRIIGQGRASELLFTGRSMTAQEGLDWGFFSRAVEPDALAGTTADLARQITEGPGFGNAMTKRMLAMEWSMSVEQAIETYSTAQSPASGGRQSASPSSGMQQSKARSSTRRRNAQGQPACQLDTGE